MSSHLDKLVVDILDIMLEIPDDGNPDKMMTDEMYSDHMKMCYALCLSSWTLYNATIRHLYREVRLSSKEPKLRQLARTLCECPGLASHIHILGASASRKKAATAPSPEELALFQRQLEPNFKSFRPETFRPRTREASRGLTVCFGKEKVAYHLLLESLRSGCYTAELILLFTLCTNVRTIDIGVADHRHYACSSDCHKDATDVELCDACPMLLGYLVSIYASWCPKWSLGNLRHVYLRQGTCWCPPPYNGVAGISSLLAAPQLKELVCRGFGSTPGTSPWVCATGASNVRRLVLETTNILTPDLVRILDSCKALQTCDIRVSGLNDDDDGIDNQALFVALSRHSQTLERLVLENRAQDGDAFASNIAFPSLQHFHKLHHLEIDEVLFIDFSDFDMWRPDSLQGKLPPALTKFVIHSVSVISTLGDILATCSEYDSSELSDLQITFPLDDAVRQDHPELANCHDDELTDSDNYFMGVVSYSEHEEQDRFVFRIKRQPMLPLRPLLVRLVKEFAGKPLSYIVSMMGTGETRAVW